MPKRLYTIGYEGSSVDDFITTLKRAGVRVLLDVRELPISRKRGFSKSSLSAALESARIDYIHLRELGDPKEGRDAARGGDVAGFVRIYSRHLRRPAAREEIKAAIGFAEKGNACLLCYERDPRVCHRSILANQMSKEASFNVQHIGVVNGIATRAVAGPVEYDRGRLRKVG